MCSGDMNKIQCNKQYNTVMTKEPPVSFNAFESETSELFQCGHVLSVLASHQKENFFFFLITLEKG